MVSLELADYLGNGYHSGFLGGAGDFQNGNYQSRKICRSAQPDGQKINCGIVKMGTKNQWGYMKHVPKPRVKKNNLQLVKYVPPKANPAAKAKRTKELKLFVSQFKVSQLRQMLEKLGVPHKGLLKKDLQRKLVKFSL